MKKRLMMIAVATALLTASCSTSDDLAVDPNTNQPTKEQVQVPVVFGTYMAKTTTTRAAAEITETGGNITTTDALKASTGFGVFAYYTGNDNYDTNAHSAAGTTGFTGNTTNAPNFMYNERIFWTTDATGNTVAATDATGADWGYWPVKFWPNDNTDADNQGATGSVAASKVSFFAYAPYAGKDDYSGDGADGDGSIASGKTSGITAISTNAATTDPTVTYKLATDGKNVDLLWGTANNVYNSAAGAATQDRTSNDYKTYYYSGTETTWNRSQYPLNIDLTKPWVTNNSTTSTDKITFHFKHALAKVGGSLEESQLTGSDNTWDKQLGGLMVMLDIDKDGEITGGAKPAETKVTIKSIKIENANGDKETSDDSFVDYDGDGSKTIADKIVAGGTLNLATGQWAAGSTYTSISHTIASPASNSGIATAVSGADTGKENEAAAGATGNDNGAIRIELAEPASVTGWDALPAGVLVDPRNVYAGETDPLVFIPGTKPAFKVTIEYIVRTKDTKLSIGYSEVSQKISKNIAFTSAVELNKKYSLLIHLGLTSVKFDAYVSEWDGGTITYTPGTGGEPGSFTGSETDNVVYLPINVKSAE